mmetsp:Transcript_15868/g.36454  ORF Transcript_15868/g.36454 Transcript_15868/m.36454 type:complete len:238 (+) Transcript_15868:284-997(+)
MVCCINKRRKRRGTRFSQLIVYVDGNEIEANRQISICDPCICDAIRPTFSNTIATSASRKLSNNDGSRFVNHLVTEQEYHAGERNQPHALQIAPFSIPWCILVFISHQSTEGGRNAPSARCGNDRQVVQCEDMDKNQQHPPKQDSERHEFVSSRGAVNFGVFSNVLFIEATIEESIGTDWHAGNEVQHGNSPLVKQGSSAVQVFTSVGNQQTCHNGIFVERKQHHGTHAEEAPTSMD